MHEYFEIASPTHPKQTHHAQSLTRTGRMIAAVFVAVSLLVVAASLGISRDAVPKFASKTERLMKNDEATVQIENNPAVGEDQTRPSVTCGSTLSGSVTNGAQAFYTLVAPDISSGSVTVSTCGSPLDTWMYVYAGNQTTNPMWNCDDCGSCNYQTVQTFSLSNQPSPAMTRGRTYTIGVGSYGSSSGSFNLQITCAMACGSTAKGSITPNQRFPINFQVPSSGQVTMSTCQSNFNTFLYVYSGSTATYSCDDCGSCSNRTTQKFVVGSGTAVSGGTGTNGLTAGATVRVEVGGSGTASGNMELNVTCAQGPTTAPPTGAPFSFPSPSPCPGGRVRKDWHDLTQDERNLYLSGYKALRTNGKLAVFTQEHQEAFWPGTDNLAFHSSHRFLPWHRYFIWELEEQIRALGGNYSCVTLPFWDWTRTAGQPVGSNPMFSQGLGGNGAAPSSCLQTGELRQGEYQISGGGCLQRQFLTGVSRYNTIQSAMLAVEAVQPYVNFVTQVEGWHNDAHVSLGGTLSSVLTATDDPIFFMLHAFVDLIWALRSDCHNYGNEESTNNYPSVSDPMSYPILRQTSWALANGRSFTAQTFLRTNDLRYTYNASNMVNRSGLAMGVCSWDNIVHRPVAVFDERTMINEDTTDGQPNDSYNLDARKTKLACMRLQEQAVRRGYVSQICRYKEPLEKCPPGRKPLVISLEELLNKRGVRGNPCIEAIRRQNYHFAKQMGTLRGLCNGYSDPVC